jgi:hypothetical protein
MLVNGVLVPITAFLMQRFTTRQLFISSMFAIGTAVVITVYTMQATSHASELSMENENITAIQLEALASILGSSDAYVFMLALSFVALIIACFMPKKAANKKSEDESQN